MQIKQDPVTGLWCRGDGAVLMPPDGRRFKSFRWTFGSKTPHGYRAVRFYGKQHRVHQIICRAFNGLAPADKSFVDHINRVRDDNRPSNLHWVDRKENAANQIRVEESLKKYGVRRCEDRRAYDRARRAAHHES